MTARDWKANPETGPAIALRYERAGLRIVPILPETKKPRVGGFGKVNPTFSVPAEDFRDSDQVAILCGPCSTFPERELLCLDLDGQFGKAELIKAVGQLPETLSSKGGRHLWYAVRDVPAREQLKQRAKTAVCEGGALDVKWRGGYALERGDWDRPFLVSDIADLPIDALERLVALQQKAGEADLPLRSEVLSAVAKVWPKDSGRYESALALGGIMGRSDWSEDQIVDFASQIFEAAGVDERLEQVLASVEGIRAGKDGIFGWPKLRSHMVGSKQAIGRACNLLSKYLGIDSSSKLKAALGTPRPGDFIAADPELLIPLDRRVDELETLAASRPMIFQRAGSLVKVQPVSRLPGDGEPLGVVPLGVNTARSELSAAERPGGDGELDRVKFWIKKISEKGQENWLEIDPPGDLAAGLLDRKDWPNVRALRGIADCPFMRPDGSICSTNGYDHASGWLLQSSVEIDAIPAEPTLFDARAAIAELVEPWAEFPWTEPAHILVPISLLLSGLARAALDDVPLHALDASTPGTGKTLVLDVVGLILTGRSLAKLNFPANDEELEKVLAAKALDGSRLIAFDNVSSRRQLGGEPLERVLSSRGRVSLRVLGKSESPELPWQALVSATGNNLGLSTDMMRRSVVGRLIAPVERPEERTDFRLGDLHVWARANRARLVRAGLVLLRAFVCAGRPRVGATLGGFESWSLLVANALQWASGGDVRSCRMTEAPDPHEQAVGQLFSAIDGLTRTGARSAKALIASAYDSHGSESLALRESFNELIRLNGRPKPDAREVGKLLGRYRDQIRANVRLVTRWAGKENVWLWSVEHI
jgi:putative DNA primase/helicase